jgi:hypothetical protein
MVLPEGLAMEECRVVARSHREVRKMHETPEQIRYGILDECKCGPEEFFVLLPSVYVDELNVLLQALVDLTQAGLLVCRCGRSDPVGISMRDLSSYIEKRLVAGENLAEYPKVCDEYTFTTTEEGLLKLREEDRPVRR